MVGIRAFSLQVIALVGALGSMGCKATFPNAPTPVLTSVELHYGFPTLVTVSTASSLAMRAYAVDSDFTYRDVTGQAAWTSSDSNVMQSLGNGQFRPLRAGAVELSATFEAVSGRVFHRVASVREYPGLDVIGGFLLNSIGATASVRAFYVPNANIIQDVSQQASWTSSDPEVATVGGPAVTATGVGTVEVTATFNGLSNAIRFSVPPRTFR